MFKPALSTRMKKELHTLCLAVFSLSFSLITPPSHAESKPGENTIKTLPLNIQNQICRDLSADKKPCGADDRIHYIRSIALKNNQVLLFFFLKDKQSRYHRSLTIPVKINSKGEWITGSTFVGEPREVLRHTSKNNRSLWMYAQFNQLGTTPILLHSLQGLDWSSINLPIAKGASYQSLNIEKFCTKNDDLLLAVKTIDGPEQTKTHYWKAKLSTLSKNVLAWKPLNKVNFNTIKCDSTKQSAQNSWLIQEGETMTLLMHETNNLAIRIPHVSEVDVEKQAKKSSITSPIKKETLTEKGFAIQVAAYSNPRLADKVVADLKQKDFKAFSKLYDNKGKHITRVYAGPFLDRKEASERLADLKKKFSGTAIASGFIVSIKY